MSVVDDCSFDFSHDMTCTEKRYVVAIVKNYHSSGTHKTFKLIRKSNFRKQIQSNKTNGNGKKVVFKFNQRITLILANFEKLCLSYNVPNEKLKTEQPKESIGKEENKTTGRKRSCHLAFLSET